MACTWFTHGTHMAIDMMSFPRLPATPQVLEDCVELRDLVRQLGRGGGKGPLRRAPEEVWREKGVDGGTLAIDLDYV